MTIKKHSKYSASGSQRWLACAGSVKLSENAPPQPESPYAKEGTDAHHCVEILLKGRKKPSRAIEVLIGEGFPKTMVDHAREAVGVILADAGDEEILCETKVSLEFVHEGLFGSVDAAVVEMFGTLRVYDFKYGAGLVVDPKDNSQLIYYALGLAHKYNFDFQNVELVIIQPRASHSSGETVRRHTMKISELMAWENIFRDGVKACEDPNAPLTAGKKQCQFCPAKPICPEISDAAFKTARLDFAPSKGASEGKVGPPVFTVPAALPLPELPSILKAIPLIRDWADSVETYAKNFLERGGEIKGFKLVEKRATRKWLNPELVEKEAVALFGEKALSDPELLSPAQLEKIKIKGQDVKAFVNANCASVSTGTTMVEDEDVRQSINQIEADFGPINNSLEKTKGKK
jgi:hypothetical protein